MLLLLRQMRQMIQGRDRDSLSIMPLPKPMALRQDRHREGAHRLSHSPCHCRPGALLLPPHSHPRVPCPPGLQRLQLPMWRFVRPMQEGPEVGAGGALSRMQGHLAGRKSRSAMHHQTWPPVQGEDGSVSEDESARYLCSQDCWSYSIHIQPPSPSLSLSLSPSLLLPPSHFLSLSPSFSPSLLPASLPPSSFLACLQPPN